MNKLKIPVMNTLSIKRNHKLDKPPFPFPFVLKEATGRGGEQVHFVKNEQMWDNIFAKLTTEDVVIQTTNVQLGKDLRVYVMGKDILCAILREKIGRASCRERVRRVMVVIYLKYKRGENFN